MNENISIPWIEKYRPTDFQDIVLEHTNEKILENIICMKYFPNLLFYGPPGTGKTTAIINLVKSYQNVIGENDKGLMIHLNASDERGIDIIRNQIQQFVNTKNLFKKGMKFVILDEVDYMTKNAQQALRCLIMNYPSNVRFCLICNYISKIDDNLQNEFIKIRFNNLPKDKIFSFLKKIVNKEGLRIMDNDLIKIQQLFHSDIRSMINFIQSRYQVETTLDKTKHMNIIHEEVWDNLYSRFQNDSRDEILLHIQKINAQYSIDNKNIMKMFFNYIIHNKPQIISKKFLMFVEGNIQCTMGKINIMKYIIGQIQLFILSIDT